MEIITQIGSLPYDSVEKAMEYSLKHDIPFLPELPKLGDAMMKYIQNPGKMSCLEEFKKHSYELVKVQCVGPATLISDPELKYDESEAVDRASRHINAIFSGLNAKEAILFLDEPSIGNAGFDFQLLWEAIFSSITAPFKVYKGVHTCGNMDWDKLFAAGIDIISFDASRYGHYLISSPKYNGFRQKGGRIAWGISNPEDIKDFREGDLITMPCGLGGMNLATGKKYSAKECENALEIMVKAKEKYII